ncbi:hypothetical protein OVS_03940 [Mycoplasma ovis str. Michigan]|uniref:Uncharacterized protein n=1 Tax=Mycoplasma ovis str. Michigan TaxID=1415773 RepID=A0ABN4BRJ7_9MOLU|nr:hypothetical protein [Mycoplasma ovis]AHC40519.1 hypothetical protein OVS_03940 [Mycoplasma ovis str. Michigan]
MPSLKFLVTGLSGIVTGGTVVGLGGAGKLISGERPSFSIELKVKDKEIVDLESKLEKNEQELLD